MSGIVGIVNLDGAPIDRELLSGMANGLRFRGPDACRTWIDGSAGFGHTLLATTDEACRERQPCTIDGDVWITADARVDARDDLTRELKARGRGGVDEATDPELILHAYAAWGDACVDRLLGDFSFAIWDRKARRLLAARDHFGVKPFYYAQVGRHLVFSNTLDCVRQHPAVSDGLDDLTVADYLLFYYKQDQRATIYREIRRLPAAHVLTWSGGPVATRRYWEPAPPAEIRYRRAHDYVDCFKEILAVSVRDRLRTQKASVFMSGGLDSPALAATAKTVLSAHGRPFDLRAYTVVFDRLIPDSERHYAGLVASSLGLPIRFLEADDYPIYQRAESDLSTPEPMDEPYLALHRDLNRLAASTGRVALTGTDADAMLIEWPGAQARALVRSGRIGALAADVWRSVRHARRLPHLGLRAMLRSRRRRPAAVASPMPAWLNPDFVQRLALRERWREAAARVPAAASIPERPRFSRLVAQGPWAQLFDSIDPGWTRIPLEQRHPFLDLRLVRYVLAIPVIPWCDDKGIIRVSMRGVLPKDVLRRPKTPVAGDAASQRLRHPQSAWLDAFGAAPGLEEYVDRARIPAATGPAAGVDALQHIRPFSLSSWMDHRPSRTPKGEQDVERNHVA